MIYKFNSADGIELEFANGKSTATAFIPQSKVKELLMDEAWEIITMPECGSSSCAENGFCECDSINEDMEFAAMYFNIESSNFVCDLNHFCEHRIKGSVCVYNKHCKWQSK